MLLLLATIIVDQKHAAINLGRIVPIAGLLYKVVLK